MDGPFFGIVLLVGRRTNFCCDHYRQPQRPHTCSYASSAPSQGLITCRPHRKQPTLRELFAAAGESLSNWASLPSACLCHGYSPSTESRTHMSTSTYEIFIVRRPNCLLESPQESARGHLRRMPHGRPRTCRRSSLRRQQAAGRAGESVTSSLGRLTPIYTTCVHH